MRFRIGARRRAVLLKVTESLQLLDSLFIELDILGRIGSLSVCGRPACNQLREFGNARSSRLTFMSSLRPPGRLGNPIISVTPLARLGTKSCQST